MSNYSLGNKMSISAVIVGSIIPIAVIVFCGFFIKYLDDMKKYDDEVSEQNKIIRKVAFALVIIYVILTSLQLLLIIFGVKMMSKEFLKEF